MDVASDSSRIHNVKANSVSLANPYIIGKFTKKIIHLVMWLQNNASHENCNMIFRD